MGASAAGDGLRLGHDLLEAIPPVRGAPKSKPASVQADTAYDSEALRARLRARGIEPLIPRRRREHGSGLGKTRWVVERAIAWLHQYRRLRVRYERRADIHEAFLHIACALIGWKQLKRSLCYRLLVSLRRRCRAILRSDSPCSLRRVAQRTCHLTVLDDGLSSGGPSDDVVGLPSVPLALHTVAS